LEKPIKNRKTYWSLAEQVQSIPCFSSGNMLSFDYFSQTIVINSLCQIILCNKELQFGFNNSQHFYAIFKH
jgi:hypothetical protein